MQPVADEALAGRGLGLRDLVFMVREDEVDATGVDVECLAQSAMLIAEHSICQPGRPWPTIVDHDGSPSLAALPQGEVADVVLAVVVGRDPLADAGFVRVERASLPYAGQSAMRKKIEPSSAR